MDRREEQYSEMDPKELLSHYEEMKTIASRDALTGLLNRGALERMIKDKLQNMEAMESCALFIIDLDNFKTVNDTLGHQAGDRLLVDAAWTLSGMFRATDIVGRLGGDEFAIFLNGRITEGLIRSKGQLICDQLQFALGVGSEIVVTASVGIHLATGETTFETLYQTADQALYRAKKSGKQRYCIKRKADDSEESEKDTQMPVNAVRLRSLLDSIDSGVAMIEMKEPMTFVYASSAFVRMLGVAPEELSKEAAMDWVHPDDKEELEYLLKTRVMEENETVSYVSRMVSKNGSVMWCRIHAVRIEYGAEKPVILITVTDVSELKEKESSLIINNDLFRIAMDQTSQAIWEVEHDTGTFRFIGENSLFPKNLEEAGNFPDVLIKKKWIHPESADSFREFASDIYRGRAQGYANFKVKYRERNRYRWTSFSYRTVFDKEGHPTRVVGIIETMSRSLIETKRQEKKASLPENLMSTLIFQFNGNLTEDSVSQCWSEGQDVTGGKGFDTCTEILETEQGRIFAPEKEGNLPAGMSRDYFLRAYQEQNEQWIVYEYRRSDTGGNIHWVSCVINLYSDSKSEDVQIALWISMLDRRRQWEKKFRVPIYRDPMTKLYACSTVREIASHILQEKEHKRCALVMIEISGLAKLYAQYSGNAEQRWKAILCALFLALGTNCVPGQYESGRYLVFFPEVVSEETLKQKLTQAFLFVRNITSDLIDGSLLCFLAGGACHYQDETDYNALMGKMQDVCRHWANSTVDRVVFTEDIQEENWDQLRKSKETDRIRTQKDEVVRPLSDRERDAAFTCILGMLNAGSLEECSRCLLQTLGEYYEADRAYILVIADQGRMVTMPHEWTSGQRRSIQHIVSGMAVSRFPLLERCAKEEKPIFLTRDPSGDKKTEEAWQFAMFPMQESGQASGYLCIENAKNYISDAALPLFLSSCLLKERMKYFRSTRPFIDTGGISSSDLPNNHSFMEVIYTFNSDLYGSLGAVCVDVPELPILNGNYGFEYGRRLLWYISQTMSDIFGRAMLYRTWDAEFVALCPNTTQQVFNGKCARLRAALTRRYPRDTRIGYAWEDKVFSGKEVVDDAKTMMRCNVTEQVKPSLWCLPSPLSSYATVGDMINAGRFTVFYQPKINMLTGEIVGAEALVRGIEESGKAIPPAKFVKELEKDNAIRDLDLYILDSSMKFLDRCRKEKGKTYPISVNFSMVTVLDPRIQASLLAIQSRYPMLDPSLIEIEVKESAIAGNGKRLQKAMRQMRECGVTFALDNFGLQASDLSLLNELTFEALKIDRHLILDLAYNDKTREFIRNIVEFCRARNIRCMTVGVETKEQEEALLRAGCIYGQGYYFGRPVLETMFYDQL